MLLTKKKFNKQFQNNTLKIAFIGMSNIGKSYRTEEFQIHKKFETHSIDHAISQKMKLTDTNELAQWMGHPYETKFQKTQKIYLELEQKLTNNHPLPKNKNFILDTTGSVVHLSKATHDYLKKNFLIIQLHTSEQMIEEMINEFFLTPKPLVWGNHFNKKETEQPQNAIRRCYPELLKHRRTKYQSLADITIPGEISRSAQVCHNQFWEIIKNTLPAEKIVNNS